MVIRKDKKVSLELSKYNKSHFKSERDKSLDYKDVGFILNNKKYFQQYESLLNDCLKDLTAREFVIFEKRYKYKQPISLIALELCYSESLIKKEIRNIKEKLKSRLDNVQLENIKDDDNKKIKGR